MRRHFFLVLLCLMAGPAVSPAVEPVPESQQARLALKIQHDWRAARKPGPPKTLHVVYYTPADREPEPRYRERLEAILEDIRAYYRQGMERTGFGPKTFDLDRDAQAKWILYSVKGRQPEASFGTWEGRGGTGSEAAGNEVQKECEPTLKGAGISYDTETVLIFCNLAAWDAKALTFRHHSPYFGKWNQTSGLCFAADTAILDVENIPKTEPILDDQEYGKMSMGRFNTIFIGGIAHELGHAFSLPHCGERWDERSLGISIMGAGNHHYREERRGAGKGAFLTMASAMKLASRPIFSKWDLDMALEPHLDTNVFHLSTIMSDPALAGRKGTLRVDGVVRGSPPIYGVIAYFDSARDGGYHAPAATAVPDNEGRYAMEISDLAESERGQLRLEYCHANGAVSEARAPFVVKQNGDVDLSEGEMREALEPVGEAVMENHLDEAQAALQTIEASQAPDLTRRTARAMVSTLKNDPKPIPSAIPATVTELPLGGAQSQSAQVGWLEPASNRLPPNREVASPFLDSGKIYATGLFAHAPSKYVFDLGGQWKTLRGQAGLETKHQSYAAGVVFVIKADGQERFRSRVIRQDAKESYEVDLAGVKTLELTVEKATDSNVCNWGLWLDPTLFR